MDIQGHKIGGLSATNVRDALRVFNDMESEYTLDNGFPRLIPKRLTLAFLAKQLNLDDTEASELLTALISEGYVDQEKLTPTTRGMALINAESRDRIPLAQAKELLDDFVKAVENANSNPSARVFIERVRVFGSYYKNAETVGDIDLQVFAPLPDDCFPEDLEEQDALLSDLQISEYLSFHDEFDLVATQAPGAVIYDRSDNES